MKIHSKNKTTGWFAILPTWRRSEFYLETSPRRETRGYSDADHAVMETNLRTVVLSSIDRWKNGESNAERLTRRSARCFKKASATPSVNFFGGKI